MNLHARIPSLRSVPGDNRPPRPRGHTVLTAAVAAAATLAAATLATVLSPLHDTAHRPIALGGADIAALGRGHGTAGADVAHQDPIALLGDAPGATAPVLAWSRTWAGVTFRESSPAAAHLGRPAIVLGALDGKVYGLDLATGANLPGWPVKTPAPVNSSPAAADLLGKGQDEIVIGSGTADHGQCSGGGVSMIDASGALRWRRMGNDPGCPNLAFHSSPTLGDVTGAGVPNISVGALGLQSWSWDTAGNLTAGWPFYTDDTVFATAALADLNGDGVPDLVMGGDSSPGGRTDHRGGVVRAVRGDGRALWQFMTDEMVRSSPAIGSLDGSGNRSIVFGTGDYWDHQPGGASDSTKVFSLDVAGHLQWSREVGGETMGGPALADVEGNGHRDVVIGTASGPRGGEVWVLGPNGKPLPQWAGVASGGGVVIGGISTADLNGDGAQDLLVPTGSGMFAYDGRTAKLLFSLDWQQEGFQSTPLVTTDPDGEIGITVAGTSADGIGVVQHWRLPLATGARLGAGAWPTFHHDARRTGNVDPPPLVSPSCKGVGIHGYWEAGSDGGVFGWCGAGFHGSPSGAALDAPVVGMASSATGHGYWLASADGGVFTYGDARFLGSARGSAGSAPIVGMARTPSGLGYWLASADGGVFAYGDAPFLGGAGSVHLPFRVVAILPTHSGRGYWLVGEDGTILTYGDAGFYGSPSGILRSPLVGGAPTPSGQGYWLTSSDGGVFTYGDAPYLGSPAASHLNEAPAVAIAPTAAGKGYWVVASDGGVFTFGDAGYAGSVAGNRLNGSITAFALPAG